MDNDTQNLINKLVSEVITEQSNLIQRGSRPQEFDICPHCKEEIYEKHTYTEDGGKTFKHSDCGKTIEYPETGDKIPDWLTPSIQLELSKLNGNLPPSGELKYSTQEPGGEMAAVNLEESELNKTETDEAIVVNSMDSQKMFDGLLRIVNTSNLPLKFTISKISVDTANAFIIRTQNI